MVWQEKVQFILMLTNLMDGKKKKCALYWPERVNETEVFGSFTVTLLEENTAINVVTRKIEIRVSYSLNVFLQIRLIEPVNVMSGQYTSLLPCRKIQ